jgi:hypothetical protein
VKGTSAISQCSLVPSWIDPVRSPVDWPSSNYTRSQRLVNCKVLLGVCMVVGGIKQLTLGKMRSMNFVVFGMVFHRWGSLCEIP